MPDDPNHNLYPVGDAWYLKVQVRGRQVRESLHTTDIAEARTRRDRRLAELHGETHSWEVAVGKWLIEYLPENVDAKTAKRYACSIGQIAMIQITVDGRPTTLEGLPIERLNMKIVGAMVVAAKKARVITNATIRRDLTALSSLFRATIFWGWREDNPARNWDRSHVKERRDPIYLPPEEHVQAVIAASPSVWGKAVQFLDETGMRETEGFMLKHSEIEPDMSGATIIGKRNRRRFVPFNPRAVGIVVGIPRHIKSPYVFWHHDGQPYKNVASRHGQIRMKGAVREVLGLKPSETDKMPTFSLHHLRHRFAVRYLKEGGSIYDLQQILGHESVKTTEVYLAFLDPNTRSRVMRARVGSAQ